MYVELAVIARVDLEGSTVELAGHSEEELCLFLKEEELTVSCTLGRSILCVPRVFARC